MSAKRFIPKVALLAPRAANRVTTVLLAAFLISTGCATTSSQNAQHNLHKPQMITANGPEQVGACPVVGKFDHGFDLSDNWASFLAAMGPVFEILGELANR